MKYVVRCALPADQNLSFDDWSGNHFDWEGLLGLAPEWIDFPITGDGSERPNSQSASAWATRMLEMQEWISACLVAHVNGNGQHVNISIRGNTPTLATLSGPVAATATAPAQPAEWVQYGLEEGGYYGNLFLPEPKAFACKGANPTAGELLGRDCYDGKCPGIASTDSCPQVTQAQCSGSSQSQSDGSWNVYSGCQNDKPSSAEVVLTNPVIANGVLTITIKGAPNSNYQVQKSTNLPDWQTVLLLTTDADGNGTYSEPVSGSGDAFFRTASEQVSAHLIRTIQSVTSGDWWDPDYDNLNLSFQGNLYTQASGMLKAKYTLLATHDLNAGAWSIIAKDLVWDSSNAQVAPGTITYADQNGDGSFYYAMVEQYQSLSVPHVITVYESTTPEVYTAICGDHYIYTTSAGEAQYNNCTLLNTDYVTLQAQPSMHTTSQVADDTIAIVFCTDDGKPTGGSEVLASGQCPDGLKLVYQLGAGFTASTGSDNRDEVHCYVGATGVHACKTGTDLPIIPGCESGAGAGSGSGESSAGSGAGCNDPSFWTSDAIRGAGGTVYLPKVTL